MIAPTPDLSALADLGPYFAVEEGASDRGWASIADLTTNAELAETRVRDTRAALEAVSGAPVARRVAASTAFLGLAARIVSPPLGLLATQRISLRLAARDVRWRPVLGGPIPLSYASFACEAIADERAAGRALLGDVLQPVIAGLVSAFDARFRVSATVLWGNVASALAGAAAMAERAGAVSLSPRGIAEHAIAGHPSLATAGRFASAPQTAFRRNSCCLFYRVPGGGLCGDCVLDRVPVRRR